MLTKDELEILNRISSKDIKKYRPDLFSDNKKDKTYTEKEVPAKTSNGSKDRASFLFVLFIFAIEVALFFGAMFYDYELITGGRAAHYILFICGGMASIWGYLPDGKLSIKSQVLVFSIIPLCEFMLIQLLGLSNWWGVLLFFVYAIILSKIFDMDFDDGTSYRPSNAEKYKEAFLTGLLKGLFR